VRRIAILYDRNSLLSNRELAVDAARALGLEAPVMEVAGPDEFAGAFTASLAAGAQAINVLASPFFDANRERLTDLAAQNRLPAMYESGGHVRVGGLISYGANLIDLFREAAGYVDKILKGVKPADLPVKQPTNFELVINQTAKALGLNVPPSILARANERSSSGSADRGRGRKPGLIVRDHGNGASGAAYINYGRCYLRPRGSRKNGGRWTYFRNLDSRDG
jgi:putative ABC transport system substrate-binding protein